MGWLRAGVSAMRILGRKVTENFNAHHFLCFGNFADCHLLKHCMKLMKITIPIIVSLANGTFVKDVL